MNKEEIFKIYFNFIYIPISKVYLQSLSLLPTLITLIYERTEPQSYFV